MDVCYQIEGGAVQRFTRRFGLLPIMVKSEVCYLHSLDRWAVPAGSLQHEAVQPNWDDNDCEVVPRMSRSYISLCYHQGGAGGQGRGEHGDGRVLHLQRDRAHHPDDHAAAAALHNGFAPRRVPQAWCQLHCECHPAQVRQWKVASLWKVIEPAGCRLNSYHAANGAMNNAMIAAPTAARCCHCGQHLITEGVPLHMQVRACGRGVGHCAVPLPGG